MGISDAISQIQKIRVAEELNGLFDATTVQQYTLAISGLNKQEAITLLQRQGLSTAQQAQILSSAGLLQTTQMLNASLVEEAVLNSKISGEKAEQILTELGLIEAKTGNLVVTKECTVAEVAQALATKGIVGADAEAILSQLGLATANTTTTVSFAGLTTAIKANTAAMAKWLVTNPVGWCILAVGAVYGLSKAYDALTISEEEMTEAHEESVQKAKDSISEYEELKQELETIQQTYDDNEQKLKDLYKLRENQTITQAEQDYLEELEGQNEKLRQQIEYKQTLADIEAKEAEDDAVTTLNEKTQDDLLSGHYTNGGATVEFDKITDAEKIKQNTATINALTADLTAYEKVIRGIGLSQEEVDKYTQQLVGYQEQLNSIEGDSDSANAQRSFYQGKIDEIQGLIDGTISYENYEKAVSQTTNSIKSLVSENDTLLQKVEPLNDAIKSTSGENYELKKTNDEIITNAKDAAIAFNGYTDSLNGTADALNDVGKNPDEIAISTISSSVQQIATQLEPQFTKLGEAYQNIFTADGFTLENVDNSMLEELRNTFAEIEEEVGVAFDATQLNDFFDALTSGDSTAEQVQQSFNDLATSYFYSTDTLEQLNETTADSIAKQLEELGVINAKEVVYDTLTTKTEALALQEQLVAAQAEATARGAYFNVDAFLNQAGATETARAYLFALVAQEQIFNNQSLDTSGKITKLKELATQYGQTALAAKIAYAEEQAQKSHTSLTESDYARFAAEVTNGINNINIDFGGVGSSASKAGKDAADKFVEAFEKELSVLDDLRERGVLTEYQYLSELRKLYNRYYRDKEKYLKNYQQMEYKYLSGLKDLYESAFSYITSQIDKRIDAINDEKDSVVDSIEAERDARLEAIELQKEQLENEIEGIEKQIEAKEKEIETIEEANKQRQQSINLQKAEYDLARMQNQKTQNVLTDDGMVWQTDTSAIRDARQEVEDAKQEIEISKIEKEISLLEEQRDVLQDQIDLLDKQADEINKYYDNLIKQTEAHYDAMIKGMEDYKSQFEELSDLMENAQMEATLQELGINMDALLNGSQEEFEKLKTAYVGILADMSRGNDEVLGQLSKLSGISAESVSYLDATKGAFDNLGQANLGTLPEDIESIATSTSELSTSAGEASTAVSAVGTSASTATSNIAPLNDELAELKSLIDEITKLFANLEFPTIGEEGYAEKLNAVAIAFGNIATKCNALKQIDFSSIVGGASTKTQNGQVNADGTQAVVEGKQGTGILGLASAIQEAVTIIQLQMSNLQIALETGNTAFDTQMSKIDEYVAKWQELQTSLAEIIGVGGGEDKEGNKNSPKTKSDSSESEGASADSIIGIMQIGGEEVAKKLDDPWLKSFNEFATGENSVQSICELIKQIVEEMAKSIQEQCASAAQALSDLATKSFTALENVGGNFSGAGRSRGGYKGTVGNAFANGTTGIESLPINGYKGLPHDEKNALRSEYGQPELTVYPNGTAELTTEPVMSDLPRGTVIFNEEQTKRIMNNKGTILGNAYANGTGFSAYRDDIVIETPTNLPSYLRPLQPGDKGYELTQKFIEHFSDMQSFMPPVKHMMEQMTESVQSMSKVVNTNTAYQQTVHNTYNVSLPNVTNESSAIQLMNELKQMSRDTYQYTHRK